jgi:hypothetical protein
LKVDAFTLRSHGASTGSLPRAWRISTPEGVFWLLHRGTAARLLSFPRPVAAAGGCADAAGDLGQGVTLALAAETEAASRWVRQGVADRAAGDVTTADRPG